MTDLFAQPTLLKRLLWFGCFLILFYPDAVKAQAFDQYTLNLNGNTLNDGTTLEFGPDGRLYVGERYGLIRVYTIVRNDAGGNVSYDVTAAETINLVQQIPNHNDDGQAGGAIARQVTGLTVDGTAANPVIYVGSSDYRVGAGGSGGDVNLDMNSGTVTRLTWNGSTWEAVDILRGLPRSEENHANNGMQIVEINGTRYLLITSGGNTNGGGPSNNFAYSTEFAWSAAVVALDLDAIEAMPILTDNRYNPARDYVFDLPTLDDPTRPNVNGITDPTVSGYDGIDVNDPFGGNDGLNQAILADNIPLKMVSPGYRNTYDLVVTADGKLYVTDNGGNGGWGGYPENEANPLTITNNFRPGEPGSSNPDTDNAEPQINNKDHLNLVTTDIQTYPFNSVYGGHPCPIRANPGLAYDNSGFPFNAGGAGLFTKGAHSQIGGGTDEFFRTQILDPSDPTFAQRSLPVNWPPVDSSLINVDNADFRNPGETNPDGPDDISITLWKNNTNSIAEYTATNFGGAMVGDLIAGRNGGGFLHRLALNPDGSLDQMYEDWLATSSAGNALGLDCQGDDDIFPGSIWVANFNSSIHVFEPNDFLLCPDESDPAFDLMADYDNDGFSNQDEINNGTDFCNGGSQPNDYDEDKISDLNDPDDDDDGLVDANDPFQIGYPTDLPVLNELFNYAWKQGYANLGFTGLMNDGNAGPNWLDWLSNPQGTPNDILGGAVGAMTVFQTAGDALNNDQRKAFQYGVNVNTATGLFVVDGIMKSPFHTFGAGQSQGLYIGDGFQDDYLKIVIGSNQEVRVEGEAGGTSFSAVAPVDINLPNNSESPNLRFMFVVDPVAGTAQARYQIIINSGSNTGEGPVLDLGTPIALSGNLLTAVQSDTTPLAVGMIGTAGTGNAFPANWESLYVTPKGPYVSNPMPDVERFTGSADETIDLGSYFGDDLGTDNLTYTVESNTTSLIGASISGGDLTLSFPAIGNPDAGLITIKATDLDNLSIEQTFAVAAIEPQALLFRVNAGGPTIGAIDGEMDWASDKNGPSIPNDGFTFVGGSHFVAYNDPVNWSSLNDPDIVATTPWDIMNTEHGDFPSSPDELKYTFDVGTPGMYQVRLFFKDSYTNTANPGTRLFDVLIENQAIQGLNPVDLSATYGHKTGVIVVVFATTADNLLDIEFIHDVENPIICGIEILSAPGGPSYPELVLDPVEDQEHSEGDEPILSLVASGGNFVENFTYSANGLPPGLSIEPTNGSILGTIDAGAADNSPYNVTVTIDKPSSSPVNETFTWSVLPANSILYRLNVGGPDASAPDGSLPLWQANTNPATSYQIGGPDQPVSGDDPGAHPGPIVMTDPSMPNGVPASLFNTARTDLNDDGDPLVWQFPATAGDQLEIRFFFAELDGSVTASGDRIFDIIIDGNSSPSLSDIDLYGDAGAKGAFMRAVSVTSDGSLDIELAHGYAGNPLLSGIEIVNLSTVPSTFPVEWLSFEAQPIEYGKVALRWETASEVNSSHFVVERSVDAQVFEPIGQIAAAGYSQAVRAYDFIDQDAERRITFYRLRQVDLDGQVSFSKQVQVIFDRVSDDLWVYPNPGQDEVYLRFPETPQGDQFSLRVINAAGRVVINRTMVHQAESVRLEVSNLPVGFYTIEVLKANGDRYFRRWSKY
jgi:large repetitive protein